MNTEQPLKKESCLDRRGWRLLYSAMGTVDILYSLNWSTLLGTAICTLVFLVALFTRFRRSHRRTVPKSNEIDLGEETAHVLKAAKSKKDDSSNIEMANVLANIKVFRYVEEPIFLELCKSLETMTLPAGSTLLEMGQTDVNLYVVVRGLLQIFIDNDDGRLQLINDIREGESLTSMFKTLALIVGDDGFRLNVIAKAPIETVLVKLPSSAFSELRISHPRYIPRIIQVLFARFQRVTFMTLASYLGLTKELIGMEATNETPLRLPKEPSAMTVSELTLAAWNGILSAIGAADIDPRFASKLELRHCPAGSLILERGDSKQGVFFVLEGILEAFLPTGKYLSTTKHLFDIRPGGLVGYMAAISGASSYFSVRARTDARVAHLSRSMLETIIEADGKVLEVLAKKIYARASPLVHQIDFALDWIHLASGQVLYRQNDVSDGIYIVLSGRLGTLIERYGRTELFGEFGHGDSVGELDVMTDSPRAFTCYAIRDTELARIPKSWFYYLASKYPAVTLQMSRIVARRSQTLARQAAFGPSSVSSASPKTICLLPWNADVPMAEFADSLKNAIDAIGPTLILDYRSVADELGKHSFSRVGKLRLVTWLEEQEEKHRAVLYVADESASGWTQRCILQADCILLVGRAVDFSQQSENEKLLLSLKTTARKELVLINSNRYGAGQHPGGSTQYFAPHGLLESRKWIRWHHHVHMPTVSRGSKSLMSRKDSTLRLAATPEMRRIPHVPEAPDPRSDFARLARFLTGTAIGLVLGGGGARGFAHVGVIKALEEASIPIDFVGGTSMGAFIGALYARDRNHLGILGRARKFALKFGSKWRQIWDLTYPVTAWFTGRFLNRCLREALSDVRIEDLSLNYFCVTTNITHSRMDVHRRGVLWRYVRASMSLSGYMPPLSDHGDMLVDGGYVNNLPADVMRSFGVERVVAVDVASENDSSPMFYGDSLSGWWLLWNRLNPFAKSTKFPTLADIQSRLAYVSSTKKIDEIKSMEGCFYVRPPVIKYQTFEFYRFDEIAQEAYVFMKDLIEQWRKDGSFKEFLSGTLEHPSVHFREGRRSSI